MLSCIVKGIYTFIMIEHSDISAVFTGILTTEIQNIFTCYNQVLETLQDVLENLNYQNSIENAFTLG